MKKNTFVEGTVIASISLIIIKVLGAIYVIPFYSIVGELGGALYSYAYTIYSLVLNICINYGGRAEIVDMTKKICELYKDNKIKLEDIDYDLVSKNLYNELPDVDLVIRTSGELRISNFMLYQASYAEYYFPETLFPDFNEKEFDKAILEFNKRNRRFGGQ